MTKIYLIRHAEAEGNLYRRVHGSYDSLITPKGWRQINALAKRFENIDIDAVYSSNLIRTQMTASSIFIPKNLPLYTDSGLREVNCGVWEDMTWGKAGMLYPDEIAYFNNNQANWKIEHSEPFEQLKDRIYCSILELAELNEGKAIAVFSHGNAIRAFISAVNNVSSEMIYTIPHCENTGVTVLTYQNGCFTVELLGDISHLENELTTLSQQNWWKDKNAKEPVKVWIRDGNYSDIEFINLAKIECGCIRETNIETTFMLMLNDTPAGFISLGYNGEIIFYYICKEFRSSDTSHILIGQAISHFRKLGFESIFAKIEIHDLKSIKFFKKYGFIENSKGNDILLTLDISYNWKLDKTIIERRSIYDKI